MSESAGATTTSVTINKHPPFPALTGQSLLAALKEQGIFVPSACGGHGVCGLCRVKVAEGAGPVTNRESALLSKADLQAGMRLACQVRVERNLRLSLSEDYFYVREYKAEVIGLRDLTADIREIRLQLKSPPALDFKAGQYIQFRIPPYGAVRRITFRAYSIASPPSEHSQLELEVKQVLNGIGSTYIFTHLKLNDPVIFNGPHGDFYLRAGDRPVILIAGGSGMAPIKAMLYDMRDRKISRKVRFFFGARARRDLFLLNEMQALEKSLPDFRFIPALSGPLPDDKWDGETGLISDVLARRIEAACPCEAYLCGSPAMIEACIKVLCAKGVENSRIFYDAFA